MVGALALHAVFEGLVFGISKESAREMFGTILAVVIHKEKNIILHFHASWTLTHKL